MAVHHGKSSILALHNSQRRLVPNLFVMLETSHVVDAQSIRMFVHANRMGPTAGGYKKQTSNCQCGDIKLPDKSWGRGVHVAGARANTGYNRDTHEAHGDFR